MTEEQRRAAAENLARRKQALRKKKAKKRKAMIRLVLIGLILLLLLTGLVIHLVKGRKTEQDKESKDKAASEENLQPDIVIGLKGSSPQMVLEGETYIENGAFAIDKNNGAIPESDIKIKGKVDTTKPGDYEITYTAGKGKTAQSVTRTVRVATEEEFGQKAVNVPVMMYHWVYTADDVPEDLDGNWILDTTLDEHLSYLESEGYYYPGWKELYAWINDEISIPAKCTVLTFDDGKEACVVRIFLSADGAEAILEIVVGNDDFVVVGVCHARRVNRAVA